MFKTPIHEGGNVRLPIHVLAFRRFGGSITAVPFDFAAIRDRLVIADGDLRGELLARGWSPSVSLELANLERPEWVRDAADSFLDAGTEILVTNTQAANPLVLGERPETKNLTSERIMEMCRRGAEICREAVSEFPAKDRFVFGAIGPVQQLLMLGEVSEGDLAAAYQNQARTLAKAGVDAILLRGFSELAALQIAVRAARMANLPVVATMAFDAGADQTETTLGVSVPQMCEALGGAGVAAYGCDGGESLETAAKVVELLRQAVPKLPIWCALDAGYPQLVEGRAVYADTPEEFAERLKPLAAAGANFIGGRHGVTPAHIAALAKANRSSKRRR